MVSISLTPRYPWVHLIFLILSSFWNKLHIKTSWRDRQPMPFAPCLYKSDLLFCYFYLVAAAHGDIPLFFMLLLNAAYLVVNVLCLPGSILYNLAITKIGTTECHIAFAIYLQNKSCGTAPAFRIYI